MKFHYNHDIECENFQRLVVFTVEEKQHKTCLLSKHHLPETAFFFKILLS